MMVSSIVRKMSNVASVPNELNVRKKRLGDPAKKGCSIIFSMQGWVAIVLPQLSQK